MSLSWKCLWQSTGITVTGVYQLSGVLAHWLTIQWLKLWFLPWHFFRLKKSTCSLQCMCCNLTKGYWIRNNQNSGWEWNGNLYNINKIQYSSSSMKKVPIATGDYLVSKIIPLTIVSNISMRNGTYPLMFTGRIYNSMVPTTWVSWMLILRWATKWIFIPLLF